MAGLESAQLEVLRWGRLDHAVAHARMRERLEARIAGTVPDGLILTEHEPVFTLGRRRGADRNVLMAGDVPVVPVERGGDVTFHGPGQLVGYPVVALPEGRRDLHQYLRGLEDVLIAVLSELGVRGGRDERNTGVWVEGRKVAAIGIACRKWVCWHGFALNVDVDLGWYQRIHPCGLPSELTTRLVDHLPGTRPAQAEIEALVARRFASWWQAFAAPVAPAG